MESSSSFNIISSQFAPALAFDDYFRIGLLHRLRLLSQWIFSLSLILFFFTFIPAEGLVAKETSRLLLAITLLSFAYWSAVLQLEKFGRHLQKPSPHTKLSNTANLLSFSAIHAVRSAERHAKRKHFFAIDSNILLYHLLKENKELRTIFFRMLLDPEEIIQTLKKKFVIQEHHLKGGRDPQIAPDFKEVLKRAKEYAQSQGRNVAEPEDILASIAEISQFFQQYLIEKNFIPERDIPNVANWHLRVRLSRQEQKKFWLRKNLRRHGTLGKDWAAGYTLTLDQFGYDLTREAAFLRYPKAVGHSQEKKLVERTLSRQETNNVLLIGNPGSGRKRIILDLASRSALGELQNSALNYQRVVELDLARLLSTVQSLEEAEAILSAIFDEVITAGNIILVIDDLHNFVGGSSQQSAGKIDISGVLSSYLRQPQFPFIALSTFAGLHRYLEQHSSLLSFFEQISVSELSPTESLQVLENNVPRFEAIHGKFISYPALQNIVNFADKYIQATPFPKKAIDLLDHAMAWLAQTTDDVLLPKHVSTVVTERTQIPVGDIEGSERERLLDLEKLIHTRLVNQDHAVEEISAALRRARSEVATKSGPMGSFLFLGPTGVGKTETAKALAAIYFGSESRIIRLDMSEFQSVSDIDRFLGTPTQDGLLTTAVRKDPFSLILLDELEKAHPNILNLFLQVLDEGHITDGLGRKTDFRHTIIIATSNAGYSLVLQAIKKATDFAELKAEMLEYLFHEGIYRPEFINRFDGVILFTPLTQEHLLQIAELMLIKLQKNMKEKGIMFDITEDLKAKIAELGYDPTFGARSMRRVLQDKVENVLAVALLSRKIKRGDRISIDPETFKVIKV